MRAWRSELWGVGLFVFLSQNLSVSRGLIPRSFARTAYQKQPLPNVGSAKGDVVSTYMHSQAQQPDSKNSQQNRFHHESSTQLRPGCSHHIPTSSHRIRWPIPRPFPAMQTNSGLPALAISRAPFFELAPMSGLKGVRLGPRFQTKK